MKLIISLFILFTFSFGAKLDSLSLAKIIKTVQKEEQIALAYKKYIVDNGMVPTLDTLINSNYLPKGFNKMNPFGKEIKISTTVDNSIENSLPESIKVEAYDHYYTGKYREYTREPLSSTSQNVKIYLSNKEKIIFERKDEINNSNPISEYSLEDGL